MSRAVVRNSVVRLATSIEAVADRLRRDLDGDHAASLLWAQVELDRLALEAEAMSEEALLREQGRSTPS